METPPTGSREVQFFAKVLDDDQPRFNAPDQVTLFVAFPVKFGRHGEVQRMPIFLPEAITRLYPAAVEGLAAMDFLS